MRSCRTCIWDCKEKCGIACEYYSPVEEEGIVEEEYRDACAERAESDMLTAIEQENFGGDAYQ